MFQLGQGKAPAYPKTMSEELREFLDLCFVSEPANRADTTHLLAHAFVQVCNCILSVVHGANVSCWH